ncbi:uncharacterized protein LOC144477710, partial [Augochlora pura]
MARSSDNVLTILQINLHRCKLAHDLMTQFAVEKEIDVAVISEPHRILGDWYDDLYQDAAIWATPTLTKKGYNIQSVFRGKGTVAITIDELKIFSGYISPNIPMDGFNEILEALENEVSRIGSNNVIILGDFNVKSTLCGSKYTDSRGYDIIEMAMKKDMMPIRSQGDYTFDRNGHRSLIDIAIMWKRLVNKTQVEHSDKESDHRNVQPIKARVNIDNFTNIYQEWTWSKDGIHMNTKEDIDRYILSITRFVKEASKKIHPSSHHKKAVWWWNERTAMARKEVIKARRIYQRARGRHTDIDDTLRLKNIYNNMKKKLKVEINIAKGEAWTKFTELIDKDPW